MKYTKLPSQGELLKLFTYNPQQGTLYWNNSRAYKAKHGKRAGCAARYVVVRINKILYPAHRVIYKLCNGDFDETKEIDHIDQNKHNNRVENLRVVTRQVNSMNKPKNKNNTSGHKGVSFCKQTQRWSAQIKINHKKFNLGRYIDINDAVRARKKAELQLL